MKINVITAMHQRADVSRVFLESFERIKKECPEHEINIFAALSDRDTDSENLCVKYGVKYVVTENKPLGKKWNQAAYLACSEEADYFLIFGDDDIPSTELFKGKFAEAMNRGDHHFGVNQVYFYSVEEKVGTIFKYQNPRLVGCGRFISSYAMEKISLNVKFRWWIESGKEYLPTHKLCNTLMTESLMDANFFQATQYGHIIGDAEFRVWQDEINKGLDGCLESRLVKAGFIPLVIETELPIITDLKSGSNIWPYEKMKCLGTQVGAEQCLSFLPPSEVEMINSLSNAKERVN